MQEARRTGPTVSAVVARARVGSRMDRAQSDDQIVALLTTRDERGLVTLYDRYGRLVYSLIVRIVRHEDVAAQMTQEVFLNAWRQASVRHPNSGHVASWLLAIAHRAAISEVRRDSPRPEQATHGPDPSGAMLTVSGNSPTDEERQLGGVRRETVLAALALLPQDQHQLLEMAYFEGLTQAQIAQRTGIPLDTIRTATYQALRHLHSSFLAEGAQADTL